MDAKIKFTSVDQYINSFPPEIKSKLKELRSIIKKAAPKADETIGYNMPAYKQEGVVVYFAGYKTHIGLYPRPAEFKKELESYKGGKGTIQFSLDEPLPTKLITDIVKFYVLKNTEKKKNTEPKRKR